MTLAVVTPAVVVFYTILIGVLGAAIFSLLVWLFSDNKGSRRGKSGRDDSLFNIFDIFDD